MERRLLLAVCLSLAMMGAATSAPTSQVVWSGLVIANNVDTPDEIPAELNRLEGTLKELFGYNQFKVIGQSRKTLVTGSEHVTVTRTGLLISNMQNAARSK